MNKVSENPLKNRETDNMSLIVVTALFVTSYLVSNIMAVKVIGLFNLFYFDAGTITFPFAYMLGDVLTEIWGYRTARKTIILAFLCNIFVVLCTQIGVWLPSPDYLDVTSSAYDTASDSNTNCGDPSPTSRPPPKAGREFFLERGLQAENFML